MYGPISPDSGEWIAMRIFNRRCGYVIFVQFLIIYQFMTCVVTEYDLRALWARYLKTIIFDALKVQRSSDAKYTPSRFPHCFEQESIVCDCMRHAALRPEAKAMFSCYRKGAAIDTQRPFGISFYAGFIEPLVNIEGVIAIQVQRCVSYCHGPNSIPNHAAASFLQAKVKGIAAEGSGGFALRMRTAYIRDKMRRISF